jgi:hypothetical protein
VNWIRIILSKRYNTQPAQKPVLYPTIKKQQRISTVLPSSCFISTTGIKELWGCYFGTFQYSLSLHRCPYYGFIRGDVIVIARDFLWNSQRWYLLYSGRKSQSHNRIAFYGTVNFFSFLVLPL